MAASTRAPKTQVVKLTATKRAFTDLVSIRGVSIWLPLLTYYVVVLYRLGQFRAYNLPYSLIELRPVDVYYTGVVAVPLLLLYSYVFRQWRTWWWSVGSSPSRKHESQVDRQDTYIPLLSLLLVVVFGAAQSAFIGVQGVLYALIAASGDVVFLVTAVIMIGALYLLWQERRSLEREARVALKLLSIGLVVAFVTYLYGVGTAQNRSVYYVIVGQPNRVVLVMNPDSLIITDLSPSGVFSSYSKCKLGDDICPAIERLPISLRR